MRAAVTVGAITGEAITVGAKTVGAKTGGAITGGAITGGAITGTGRETAPESGPESAPVNGLEGDVGGGADRAADALGATTTELQRPPGNGGTLVALTGFRKRKVMRSLSPIAV